MGCPKPPAGRKVAVVRSRHGGIPCLKVGEGRAVAAKAAITARRTSTRGGGAIPNGLDVRKPASVQGEGQQVVRIISPEHAGVHVAAGIDMQGHDSGAAFEKSRARRKAVAVKVQVTLHFCTIGRLGGLQGYHLVGRQALRIRGVVAVEARVNDRIGVRDIR